MINFFGMYEGVELIIVIVAFLIAILFGLTIHEYSHSLVAFYQGDVTSKYFGRLSLNPLKHIDPIGFFCLVFFGFGWAKPVPVNTVKFKNYKKGIFLTSIAGVCANIISSFVFIGILTLIFSNPETILNLSTNYVLQFIYYILVYSASINLGLAIFNILPIPPLDGFNMIASLSKTNNKFLQFLMRYGFLILVFLLLFNVIDVLFEAIYGFVLPAFTNFWQNIFF